MMFGARAALLTPFDASGEVDARRLAAHARHLLERGLAGVVPFGTTGEGASITSAERARTLDTFAADGLPMDRVTLGIAACAVGEVLAQAHAAHERGVGTILLPPPFYYPDPGAEGVYDWYASVLAELPDPMQVVLYHIPQVIGTPLTADVAGRLHAAFPENVRAIKDSSGDRATARAFLALGGPEVLIGDERLLADTVAAGASGAISGMANLHPERLVRLLERGGADAALDAEVDAIVARPVVPALKALMGEGDPVWKRLRPPLAPLSDAARSALFASLGR